jgi:hypothetical protein
MKRITIRVQPNAKKSEVVGCIDGVWKIKLKAPAIEGKANEALIKFLAKKIGVAQSEIEIVRGKTARTKILKLPDSTSTNLMTSKGAR